MPVEIREVVLRARVVPQEPEPTLTEHEPVDPVQLKAEILATCERMIRDELTRSRSR